MKWSGLKRRAALGGLGCALLAAGTVPVQAASESSVDGEFVPLPAASGVAPDVTGRAHLVRTGDGRTLLTVHLKGLAPGATYGVHLHNAPCSAANPGGAHYRHDPQGPAQPPNELWASSDPHDPLAGVAANPAGNAQGRGVADWTAGDAARAVVIHIDFAHGGVPSGGAKLACADLT
jgi:hypothetical protein